MGKRGLETAAKGSGKSKGKHKSADPTTVMDAAIAKAADAAAEAEEAVMIATQALKRAADASAEAAATVAWFRQMQQQQQHDEAANAD